MWWKQPCDDRNHNSQHYSYAATRNLVGSRYLPTQLPTQRLIILIRKLVVTDVCITYRMLGAKWAIVLLIFCSSTSLGIRALLFPSASVLNKRPRLWFLWGLSNALSLAASLKTFKSLSEPCPAVHYTRGQNVVVEPVDSRSKGLQCNSHLKQSSFLDLLASIALQ